MMDHIISADELETVEVQIKTMDWARELTELYGRANKEAIHQAM
jgi:hypothetical protein